MTNPSPLEASDELLGEVRQMIKEVQGLSHRLETLYAPRAEVVRDSRRRAWRFFASAVVVILTSQALTMVTISTCFLDAGRATEQFCSLMPGYSEAFKQSDARIERFERLLGGIETNGQRIEEIDQRLKRLEAER